MNQLEVVNQLAYEDYERITGGFISEAIRQWDVMGSGCFPLFMKLSVNQMWVDMVSKN